MSGRVTIKSIARDLGISHMTVSRALSGHPSVLPATKDSVLKRAKELGYVRNAAASVMRGDGARIVGLLLPNIINEFYARFANTMALKCEDAGLQLIIHLTNDDIAAEANSLKQLHEVQAHAVVMVPSPGSLDEELPHLRAMSVVQLIRKRDIGFGVPSILVDDFDAIHDAVVHLAQAGHRDIAFIGASADLSSGKSRRAAYEAGLVSAGLSLQTELLQTGSPTFDCGHDKAHSLLKEGTATAIVCGGFEMSNGALSSIIQSGKRPGPDIGFIGYGDPSFYAWVGGGISTISVPVDELAFKAVALISDEVDARRDLAVPFMASLRIRN
ncbi:LacI family DNA-binding transcriptional regulator [uncultured Pelagimonas sp.]|uniref:LacI family DNA-binding transcriptional regulator n=1 Tax=uncultured Pelagimonas sp. TaxID=1618102 RepID=UPI0026249B7F|nr:LacI family DNA-binding transcriptional regulator [uncultured Pelagimonas sp.]